MPRPALVLDVDGVLNPYGTVTCPEGFTEYDLFPGEEPVRLCPAHGERITELRNVFDVAWATAWNDDGNRLLAPPHPGRARRRPDTASRRPSTHLGRMFP